MKKFQLLYLLFATSCLNFWTMVNANAETESKSLTEAQQKEPIKLAADAQPAADAQVKIETATAAREKLFGQVLADAEALEKSGKSAEAYALLAPLEFERSGDVRFDYLLGIAALDSGKPDKATLAFERVLAINPNFAGARLDMARAYFQLGDMPRAKTEFDAVMLQNPPVAAKLTIQKYLDAIKAQEEAKKTRVTAYIEGMFGRDNNVNNATGESKIPVPAFGNLIFTLNPSSVKTADNYAGLAMGSEINHSLNQKIALYAGVDVHQRSNQNQTLLNSTSVDERAGLSFATGAEMFRVGVMANQFMLARVRNRNTTGISGEWRHSINPNNQFNVIAIHSLNRFVDPAVQVNDFDQNTLGLGMLHVMPDGKSVLFGSLFYGNEKATAPISATNPDGGRADGDKKFNGLRIGGQTPVNDTTELFASMGTQQGKYDKYNAAFMETRADRMDDLSVGANWHWDKLWTLRPQVAWSRNTSNIVIYAFDRVDVSVTVHRDFN